MADLSNYASSVTPPVTSNLPKGQQAGAGGQGAAPTDLPSRLNTVKLTADQLDQWWKDIAAAEELIKNKAQKWDVLLKAYMPMVVQSGTGEDVKTQLHFRNVHTKIGQMFVKSPKVLFEAEGPMRDKVMVMDPATGGAKIITPEEAVLVKQHVINKQMSAEPDCINGLRLMDECLFDILTWSGLAAVKVGYCVTIKPVQRPRMQPDPNYVPPPMVGLQLTTPPPPQVAVIGPDGQPVMDTIDVPVHHSWYAKRFSPKKLIMNADLHSTRYQEEATFIGQRFFMTKRAAVRMFGLTEQELTASSADDLIGKSSDEDKVGDSNMVEGYEIFYKAATYTDEIHPLAMNQLVLLKGLKEKTVVSRPSPDQTFDEMGQLTPDSLVGFPFLVGSVRDLADSPFPPSDTAFTNSQVKFQDTFLQQGVKLRDAQIGKYLYDTDAFEELDIDVLKNAAVGEYVGVAAGKLANGVDKIIAATTKVTASQDDYRIVGIIKQAMDETLGISSTQAGAPAGAVRSATEVQDFQQGSSGRIKKEQARAIEFYIQIVRAVDTLVTRYADGQHYINVEGADGAKKLAQWNAKLLQAAPAYNYSIKTDSQLDNDVARDRQQEMSFYNQVAKDPLVNRIPVLQSLARKFGYNPWEVVLTPEQAAAQAGMIPPHGGPANKHELENSGQKPGGVAGDNRQERNPQQPQQPQQAGPGGGGMPSPQLGAAAQPAASVRR